MPYTTQQKLSIAERLMHALQATAVTGNKQRQGALMQAIFDWSYAHRAGNGELDNDELIEHAWKELANKGGWKE